MMANEKRLIDANEAIKKINCLCVDGNENWIGTDNQSFVDHADVIEVISDMPTVDAVEVVHGRWLNGTKSFRSGSTFAGYYCSVCDEFSVRSSNYCSNCGAVMDGGDEDG